MVDFHAQAELESEFNARYDYWAEIAHEHAEDPASLEEEYREEAMFNEVVSLRFPVSIHSCGEINREIEIPF